MFKKYNKSHERKAYSINNGCFKKQILIANIYFLSICTIENIMQTLPNKAHVINKNYFQLNLQIAFIFITQSATISHYKNNASQLHKNVK